MDMEKRLDKNGILVTIFTPVYNRAHTMERLYQSLLQQTDFHFEWLIIDDGSEDEISDVVHRWIQDNNAAFEIRFYQQKNGGKHRAINRGMQLANGEAFFVVDSDDNITKDAVQLIRGWWETISGDNEFAGVAGLKGTKDGEVIGGNLLEDTFVDATNMERKEYGLLGDKAEVYKTSVLRRYPFPEFDGENFLTEDVVWDRIARAGLKIRWFNRIIMICEYRDDGLTKQGKELFVKNPKGWGLHIYQKCEFFHLTVQNRMDRYFEYYIDLKDKMNSQEIQENLGIDKETMYGIEQLYEVYIKETIDKIGRKIALYGGGNRGKELLNLYRDSEIEVCYILDRKKLDLPYLQIGLEDTYPHVDAIIITPQEGQEEIKQFLKKRTLNRLIGYDEWERLLDRRAV